MKTILIGDSCAEKTKLVTMLTQDDFDLESHAPTINIASTQKSIQTNNGICTLDIFDTAGQERYKTLAPMYMRSAKAIILVLNANIEGQIDSLQKWLDFVKSDESVNSALLYIAATNCFSGCVIDPQKIKEFADQNKIPFFATDFKNKSSIIKLFDSIASDLMEKHQDDDTKELEKPIINNDTNNEEKKSCLIC